MGYLQAFLLFSVLVTISQTSLATSNSHAKQECPAKPPGISSFRPAPGTRLYYAWSTVQGSAKQSFLSNTLCRGGRILDCSCIGYDVVGYNKTNVETQEGFTFAVNKKQNVADFYHFTRPWTKSGDYYLKCHYDRDYRFGIPSQDAYYKRGSRSSSYKQVWKRNNATATYFDEYSGSLKVLSWTSTEVVFYDCASKDPDIRVYTTYVPQATAEIPYSVFDILNQVNININLLRWYKIDHKKCVYPNAKIYAKLLPQKNY